MVAVASQTVEGHVSRGFEAVREVFAENFVHRHELGGACCAYVHGEKVVDLWGGMRNKETGEPWERDTMVLVCHQGPVSDDSGHSPLPRLARLRKTGGYVLARVRAARQREDHITNRIGTYLTGAPCDVALSDALYAALQSSEFMRRPS